MVHIFGEDYIVRFNKEKVYFFIAFYDRMYLVII